jgi:hypothetical protein
MPTPSREERRPESFTRKPKGWGPGFSMPYAVFAISIPTTIKNRKQDADRRWSYPPHLTGAAPPSGAARLSASHHGSHQRESSSLRLSVRPGFLGRGLTQIETIDHALAQTRASGRYPPSPVPVQGSTPRPGRNAGGLDARAARERGGCPHPRAPHSPRRRRVPSPVASVLSEQRRQCIYIGYDRQH